MRSPFPGMDPYLEQFWGDVHHRLITYLSDAIQKQLPGDLRARVDERVYVEPEDGNGRRIVPDVRIVELGRRGDAPCERVTASHWQSHSSSTWFRTSQCGKASSRSSTSSRVGVSSP